ncbi:MAG: hypothetical protein M1812_006233 [Candelaria pacifica]|nr:MAG: hypothetical protein M1812_006233 [Candelaria pacifica]
MSEHHQLFVLARVKGRYRSLAAVDASWFHGYTAVRQCHRVLNIFRAAENHIPLRHELESAAQLHDGIWNGECSWSPSKVYFPFVTTCLILGASFDPSEGYAEEVAVEPFNMTYDGAIHNDNGITIIDITCLDHVRYCFVAFRGMESEREVPRNTPLSAETYLEAYCDRQGWKEEYVKELDGLRKFELIPIATLRNAWEFGDWGDSLDEKIINETYQKLSSPSVRSLADISMRVLIDNALAAQPDDDLSWMEEVEFIPEFLSALKSRLYQNPDVAKSAVQCFLLRRVLQGEKSVDLSLFKTLSSDEVLLVLESLQEKELVTSLDLSNLNVSKATLEKGLRVLPKIRQLYIMNTPKIPLQSALLALQGPEIRDVYHTEMLQSAFPNEDWDVAERDALLTWGSTQSPIVQVLWAGSDVSEPGRPANGLNNGCIDWMSTSMKKSEPHQLGAFPLTEAFIPPIKIVTGLTQLLRFATSTQRLISPFRHVPSDIGKAVANSFALASSYVPDGFSVQVGSLLSVLAQQSDRYSPTKIGAAYDMHPNQWTVIIMHEYCREKNRQVGPKPRLRYAFLTPVERLGEQPGKKPFWSTGNFVVADISLFLERAMRGKVEPGLKEYWDKQMEFIQSNLESSYNGSNDPKPEAVSDDLISVCSKEEVISLLTHFPKI